MGETLLVKEMMTAPRMVLAPHTTVREAARLFAEQEATAAPVVDDTGALLGIVTEIDLLRDRFEADPRAWARPVDASPPAPPESVTDVMTREVVTIAENNDVADLVDLMVRRRLREVPVLRAGRVVGMLSRGDLLRMHYRTDAEVLADLRAALAEGAPYVEQCSAQVRDGFVHLDCENISAQQRRLVTSIARTVPGVSRVIVDNT
ncbi:CBS domain-containing protein [Lipingzhangella sp. LS1_29]|uniref:CBS domain-containing protein n=1 Tax=Lipingzhangella rawalii TaxID=2055835 RepID=A0ABU2HC16_9ACTN|nr:CBS domain-containing protein [Lipingzhangella rawalii]MDS1272370.1 CBS domain-containing protein [Lipingzhangella rawalii]